MDGNVARQLGFYLLFWVVYFLVVYSVCVYVYFKQRTLPPKEEGILVRIGGRTLTAIKAWEETDQALRKRLFRIGVGLMVAPVFLRILTELLG